MLYRFAALLAGSSLFLLGAATNPGPVIGSGLATGPTTIPQIFKTKLYGGLGGKDFDDCEWINQGGRPSSITIRGAKRLDGLSFTVNGQNYTRGGSGGQPKSLELPSKGILAAEICWDEYKGGVRMYYANITASPQASIQVGTRTPNCYTATAKTGYTMVGAFGRAKDEIDALGFIFVKLN